MSGEEDLKQLWQSQDVPKTEIDMQALSLKATSFQETISHRNVREYVAALLGAPVFIWVAVASPAPLLTRVGSILIVAGSAVAVAHVRLRGHAALEAPPAHGPTEQLIAWHRAELERQRQVLLRVPRWYVGPIVPGLVLFFAGFAAARPERWLMHLGVCTVGVVVTGAILWANRVGARKLERQIAELDG
jgi:hypothetical protein